MTCLTPAKIRLNSGDIPSAIAKPKRRSSTCRREPRTVDLELKGRVAVVTGGSSGIGAAVVDLLQQEAACPVIWDLQEPLSSGPAAPFLNTDVSDESSVTAAWRQTLHKFGEPEILVHCAAIGSGCFGFPWYNVPASAWEKTLQVNIMGMTHVATVAGRFMAEKQRGAMVFLSSVAGQIGSRTDPPYSASKAANINFAQCLAQDLAPAGVRVNTVCPGMVRTPLNQSVWKSWAEQQQADTSYDDWATEKIGQVVPLGRWQKAEDVANAIVFLCSNRAGEITGQTINVDGGFVMHS